MAKSLDPQEVVSTEEIIITNMVEISALIELLMEKFIITRDGLMEICKKLRGRSGGVSCLFESVSSEGWHPQQGLVLPG